MSTHIEWRTEKRIERKRWIVHANNESCMNDSSKLMDLRSDAMHQCGAGIYTYYRHQLNCITLHWIESNRVESNRAIWLFSVYKSWKPIEQCSCFIFGMESFEFWLVYIFKHYFWLFLLSLLLAASNKYFSLVFPCFDARWKWINITLHIHSSPCVHQWTNAMLEQFTGFIPIRYEFTAVAGKVATVPNWSVCRIQSELSCMCACLQIERIQKVTATTTK